jgi:hypothetical protein
MGLVGVDTKLSRTESPAAGFSISGFVVASPNSKNISENSCLFGCCGV